MNKAIGKILILFLVIFSFQLLSFNTIAQVPEAFSYQAVVRNSSGDVISNQNVAFKISILQNSESGIVAYAETHQANTNAYGLANLKIGKGTVKDGAFDPGSWGLAKYFIKVEIDVAGGTNFIEMGTTQLLAVPYAFHAKTVENDLVNDADADAYNELQTLSLSGTQLSLSDGGGTVTLPNAGSGGDNWGTQSVISDGTLSGQGTTASPLGIDNSAVKPSWTNVEGKPAGFADGTDNINDADADANNEIQTLSVSGNDLSISDGNTVSLPEGGASVWTENGNNISFSNGNVGIGSTNPNSLLAVGGNGNDNCGIYSEATDRAYAIFGKATAGDFNYAGYFETNVMHGIAVYGENTLNTQGVNYGGKFISNSSNGTGVYGEAPNVGVLGESVGAGVYGKSTGSSGTGVFGGSTSSSGTTYGGRFNAESPQGTGVKATGGKYDFYAATEDGESYFAGKVGIGTITPEAKLAVGGKGEISDAIYGKTSNLGGSAIYGEAVGTAFYGGKFIARATNGVAVHAFAVAETGITFGGSFTASSVDGTGVYATGGRYDFYAGRESGKSYFAGKVGIGTTSPACRLHIKQDGTTYKHGLRLERPDNTHWWSIQNNHLDDLVFDFNNSSTRAWIKDEDASYNRASDRSLKQDINSIPSVLSKIMKLEPVTFKFKSNPNANECSYGFIAQEVEKLYPEFVSENNGTLGLAYQNFGVIGIKAIQEQQEMIEGLKNENSRLKADNLEIMERLEKLEERIENGK